MQDTLHLFIQVVRLTFFDRFIIKTGSTQSTRRTRLPPREDKLGGKNQDARASAHVIKLIRKYITTITLYCMCAAQKTRLITRTESLRFVYGGENYEPTLDKSILEELFKFIFLSQDC